jgi:zinc protease
LKNPALETATDFIGYCGAGTYDLNGLKTAFAAIGCTYSLSCEDNYLVLNLEGKEASVAQSLELANLILTEPVSGVKSKSILLNGLQTERKFEKRTPDFMGRALLDYVVLGKESSYLKRETVGQIQSGNEAGWITIFKNAVGKYSADILYTGNKNAKEVADLIESKLKLTTAPQSDEIVYIEGSAVAKNTIYFVNDKKAVQSQVYFYVPGEKTGNEKYADVTAFNEYFSGGFSGLMLQEIREYRSLAYSTGGRYGIAPVSGRNGRLVTYIGCQADKTAEACEVMISLIKNMPLKEERMNDMKQALQIKAGNSYPEFRELATTVVDYKRKGYNEDPNQQAFKEYNNFSSAVLNQFYQSHIQGKPYVITIYGDKSRIDLEKLKALGNVVELKQKDFIVF